VIPKHTVAVARPTYGILRDDEERCAQACWNPAHQEQKELCCSQKINGKHIKVGLVAAVLFLSAYAVETKAILTLETSQNLFEVMR
jgi:hypothetical protein